MDAAIILNGTQLSKIIKNKKFNKIVNNPNIKILEECSSEQLDTKYEYWKNKLGVNKKEEDISDKIKLYHFINKKSGYTITSIYPDLKSCKLYILDWEDYERIN